MDVNKKKRQINQRRQEYLHEVDNIKKRILMNQTNIHKMRIHIDHLTKENKCLRTQIKPSP